MLRPVRRALATLLAIPVPCQNPAQPSKELAEVAAAYAAKIAASALFVSGRTLDSVLAEELSPTRPLETLIRPLLKFEVDAANRAVTCRLGAAQATAVATQNLGCSLVHAGVTAATLRSRGAAVPELHPDTTQIDWPLGDRLPEHGALQVDQVDTAALARALDAAFAEPAAGLRVHTRAVVVVHKGRLVAERYAPGYHAGMALPGWSMTKTIVNALVGIRIAEGRLDAEAPLPVTEWSSPAGDSQQRPRLQDLMTMTAGLAWNEDYADMNSDVLRMLFRSDDHASVYARQPRTKAPGLEYLYASGSTNLVCRVLRTTFPNDAEYWGFPRARLFTRLGMYSAVVETDPSGTFVGSSYGFASARDWARLGMLYAQDGEFAGRRVLPEGWVAKSAEPLAASNGRFGSHVWLNADPDGDGPRERAWTDLPKNLLHMDGHEGQYTIVMPTEQIVIVRLGCTKNSGFDLHGLARNVLRACGG